MASTVLSLSLRLNNIVLGNSFFTSRKGVYVLIASQVKFREAEVIYNTDDYALVKYDTENEDAIHLYDKIITQGKDLENGKVYT